MIGRHAGGSERTDCSLTTDAVVVSAGPEGRVDLEFDPPPRCAGCAGTCLWKRIGKSRIERMSVASPISPGTRVVVELPASRLLAISVMLYGLPLAAILLGAVVGAGIGRTDLATLVGVVVAVGTVTAIFGKLRRRLERALLAGLTISPRR